MAVLQELIDKQDGFEIIRDQIASILVLEVANQMALATAATKDPALWDLQIYTEAHNPWEKWLNQEADVTPIVNIWVDGMSFDPSKGNVVERQTTNTIYNIDCIGFGKSADNPAGGHTPGDKEAALEAQRAVMLVRNILMSGLNTYLQLQGTIGRRWIQSISFFQPEQELTPVQHIHGSRIALDVQHNEFSPQYVATTLELLSIQTARESDGKIVLEADYAYPITP